MYWCLCVFRADARHPLCPQLHVRHKCVLTAVCVGCHETRPSPPHEARAAFLPAEPRAPVARKNIFGSKCHAEEKEPGNVEGEARNMHG